jgi:hypothetical protein
MAAGPLEGALPPVGGRSSAMDERGAAGRESRVAKAREEMVRLSASTDTARIMQCLRKHANGAPELKPVWLKLQQQLRRVSGVPVDEMDQLREPEPEPEPPRNLGLAEVLRRADETLEQAARSRYILTTTRTPNDPDGATTRQVTKTSSHASRPRVKQTSPQRALRLDAHATELTPDRVPVSPSEQKNPARKPAEQSTSVVQQHEPSFRQRQAAAEARFRQRKERAAQAKLKRQEENEESPEVVWRRGLRLDAATEADKGLNPTEPAQGLQPPTRQHEQAGPRDGSAGAASPVSPAEAILTARQRVKAHGSPTARELKVRLQAAEALIADLTRGETIAKDSTAAGSPRQGVRSKRRQQLRSPPRRKPPVDFDTMFDDHSGADGTHAGGNRRSGKPESDAELARWEAEQKKWEAEMIAEVEAARRREREAKQALLESQEEQHELRHELVKLARRVPIDPSEQPARALRPIAQIEDEFPILKKTPQKKGTALRQSGKAQSTKGAGADSGSLRSRMKLEISAEAVVVDTIRAIRDGKSWGNVQQNDLAQQVEEETEQENESQRHSHHLLRSLSQASFVLRDAQADLISALDGISTQPMDMDELKTAVDELPDEVQDAPQPAQKTYETDGVVSPRTDDTSDEATTNESVAEHPPESDCKTTAEFGTGGTVLPVVDRVTGSPLAASDDSGSANGRVPTATVADRNSQLEHVRGSPEWHSDRTQQLEEIQQHSNKIRRDMARNSNGRSSNSVAH